MAKLLWQPSEERIKNSNMYRFMNIINEKYNKDFAEYTSLWEWSTENIPDFWASMWEFAGIKASQPYGEVVDDLTKMPGAKWFPGAKLNFAENLLRYRDDQVALIFKGEAQDSVQMTYAELYDEVARVARSLKETGVQVGDRVAGFMPNMPQTIIAMLAATSLAPAGLLALQILASRVCWIDSARFSLRCCSRQMDIPSRKRNSIPLGVSPIS